MKEQYNIPEMDIICFETEDVITTSGNGNGSSNETGELDLFG